VTLGLIGEQQRCPGALEMPRHVVGEHAEDVGADAVGQPVMNRTNLEVD